MLVSVVVRDKMYRHMSTIVNVGVTFPFNHKGKNCYLLISTFVRMTSEGRDLVFTPKTCVYSVNKFDFGGI